MEEKEVQELIIPIKWKSWDEFDILANFYFDVTFTNDFGNFKKGENFRSMLVDYQNGLVEGYSEDGKEVMKSQKFKCTPIE